MGNVFWSESAMTQAGRSPSTVAIGDPWFWGPFPDCSLANQVGRIVESKEHVLFAIRQNGPEIVDYVSGKYAETIKTALLFHGHRPPLCSSAVEATISQAPMTCGRCSIRIAPRRNHRKNQGSSVRRLIKLVLLTSPLCAGLAGCAHLVVDPDGTRHIVGFTVLTLPPAHRDIAADAVRLRTLGLTAAVGPITGSHFTLGYSDTTIAAIRNDVAVSRSTLRRAIHEDEPKEK